MPSAVSDPAAFPVEEIFDRDIAQCREVTLDELRKTPRLVKFRNSFARLFSAEI